MRSQSFRARVRSRWRAAGEAGKTGGVETSGVVAATNLSRASALVTQLAPRRIASRRTRPCGVLQPWRIQRRTVETCIGRPLRPQGRFLATWARLRTVSFKMLVIKTFHGVVLLAALLQGECYAFGTGTSMVERITVGKRSSHDVQKKAQHLPNFRFSTFWRSFRCRKCSKGMVLRTTNGPGRVNSGLSKRR
jgi:hypothetical protein